MTNKIPALTQVEIERHMVDVPGWDIVIEDGEQRLKHVFKFADFARALAFTNRVGQLAEQANHHPALLTEWGKVTVYWWTHTARGLQLEDFAMARRTSEVFSSGVGV